MGYFYLSSTMRYGKGVRKEARQEAGKNFFGRVSNDFSRFSCSSKKIVEKNTAQAAFVVDYASLIKFFFDV